MSKTDENVDELTGNLKGMEIQEKNTEENQTMSVNQSADPEIQQPQTSKRPTAPKRATTAYINFTQFYRDSIKKSGRPVPPIGEFGKECACKWNSMSEDEKRPFIETAERDRER